VLNAQLVELAIVADGAIADFGFGIADYADESPLPEAIVFAEFDGRQETHVNGFGDIAVSRPTQDETSADDLSFDDELVVASL
jgi:hypothetical protein